jgi:hypothetical protein
MIVDVFTITTIDWSDVTRAKADEMAAHTVTIDQQVEFEKQRLRPIFTCSNLDQPIGPSLSSNPTRLVYDIVCKPMLDAVYAVDHHRNPPPPVRPCMSSVMPLSLTVYPVDISPQQLVVDQPVLTTTPVNVFGIPSPGVVPAWMETWQQTTPSTTRIVERDDVLLVALEDYTAIDVSLL